jgi:hypothetical protein
MRRSAASSPSSSSFCSVRGAGHAYVSIRQHTSSCRTRIRQRARRPAPPFALSSCQSSASRQCLHFCTSKASIVQHLTCGRRRVVAGAYADVCY